MGPTANMVVSPVYLFSFEDRPAKVFQVTTGYGACGRSRTSCFQNINLTFWKSDSNHADKADSTFAG